MILPDLEERLAAKIEAIDATPYQHEGQAIAFAETPYLSVSEDGKANAHLSFGVETVEQRRDEDQERERPVFQVNFLYHLRAQRQRADRRDAQRAARDIVFALTAPDHSLRAEVQASVTWVAATDEQGQWLLATLRFNAFYDFED